MDSARWHILRRLFDEALALPPERRGAFLDTACNDSTLRREVLDLLASQSDDSGFLERPVRDEALRLVADSGADRLGDRIGAYRLVRKIGAGGMGTVYFAERDDGQFDQRVAVKLVRRGPSSEALLERLRHERQILASLQHPNIARLLGGGMTDDGLPYLVMEYVDGLPIDEYAARTNLTTAQRLELFRTVCAAVHYAHQNLIVHRDLKPSNILVSPPEPGAGTPGRVKLLDFGIAKLLDARPADPVLTRTGFHPMTPAYASPEQVRGGPITTATDVYALGVVLYELLTGHRPYRVQGLPPTGVERLVCETMPPRPSQHPGLPERLRRRLRGDLDTIVLTALRKEPDRRYASAEQFSEDVRRHLIRLPVRARPDTVGYRIATFVRRHTVGFAASMLAVAALLIGLGAFIQQAREAEAARARAERQFDDVRGLVHTLLFDLHDAVRDLPGATTTRRLLVAEAVHYLNRLMLEAGDDPELLEEAATAYTRVGEVRGDPHYPNLGDLPGAEESYRRAVDLRETLWQHDTTDVAARHALARAYGRLAVVRSWGGSNGEAIRLSRHALGLLASTPDAPSVVRDRERIRSELGGWLIWGGQAEAGLAELERAAPRLERLAHERPDDLDLQIDLWRVYAYQRDGLRHTGNLAAALDRLVHYALPHLVALDARLADTPRVLSSLATCLNDIGMLRAELGQRAEAVADLDAALRLVERLNETDPINRTTRLEAATIHVSIGEIEGARGRWNAARASFEEALTIRESLHRETPGHAELAYVTASAHRYLCRAYVELGRLDDARAHCDEAVALQEPAAVADRANAVGRAELTSFYASAAHIHAALARRAAGDTRAEATTRAIRLYDAGIAHLDTLQAADVSFRLLPRDSLAALRDALAASLPTR